MEDTEKTNDKSIEERVHQQLIYKDNRIIDLNNVILDKERQILDLQERVKEQGEVANVKNQAMRIVQQKFEEMHKERKDMATETDLSLVGNLGTASSVPSTSYSRNDRRARSSSPGHVIANRKGISTGTFSPPPIDPPIDKDSRFGHELPDVDGLNLSKKYRKRVTFDLPPSARPGSAGELVTALTEASFENEALRKQVEDLNFAVETMKEQYEREIEKYTKEAKTAGLKARVVATARIKELENSLELLSNKYNDETDRRTEEIGTLRNSRDWEVEQNGQLREQIRHLKEKAHKLTEELDESEKNKRRLDDEVEESKKTMELMVDDLLQAENIINFHENQKDAIFEDVDRLKDAIVAQDRFIEILEADIVIYEQHIGLLRESLGASKIDHRALIKSKAFETKLLALEKEKEIIDKRSNEDRLKTKALDKKCRVLVEQNEQLMAKLCELEMSGTINGELKEKTEILEEQVRQISEALESERDVSQKLREAKEAIEARNIQISRESESVQREAENSQESIPKLNDVQNELEAVKQSFEAAMEELEELRAANFELQMNVHEANRNVEKVTSQHDQLKQKNEEMEGIVEEKEEELKQCVFDIEQLVGQNEALRVDLDSARFGLKEAEEVQEQVRQLKQQLDRQEELARQQYEDACRRLEEEPITDRKSSMEVQHEQYILAFERKVEKLEKELEDGKQEKRKLKMAVKQLKEKLEAAKEPEQVVEKVQAEALQTAPSPQEENKSEDLKKRIDELEMENKLSGELNIELGRAMLEMEEQIEVLLNKEQEVKTEETNQIELQLHGMLVEEMTAQIEDLNKKIEIMEEEKQKEGEAHKEQENRLLHNMAEFEIARKDELEESNKIHQEEVRKLSIQLEDARREILDLDVKLKEKVDELEQVKEEEIQRPFDVEVQENSETPSEHVETNLVQENQLLRECVNESNRVHSDVSRDMEKLIELKEELEIAVNALKGEIWTLNGQLKESILDREQLEFKVSELDSAVEKEKKRAIGLDADLQEQIDLTDRALRRAAEAENDSNRRLAECLEMEERRETVEKAYASLTEYYNQLQTAYNGIYAQLAALKQDENAQTSIEAPTTSSAPSVSYAEIEIAIDSLFATLQIIQNASEHQTSHQKLLSILEKVRKLVLEVEETRNALMEQRKISDELQKRLEVVEEGQGTLIGKERMEQLEGEVEWKELECEGLKRRIDELEKALDVIAEKANEDEAATVNRLSMELAILAAKLTTRQADVDSLFRTNAELAHTNVRLQNGVDEMEEVLKEKEVLEKKVKELEEQVEALKKELKLREGSVAYEMDVQRLRERIVSLEDQNEKLMKKDKEHENNEIQRLTNIEKILNNRILALEDQNLELEERLQDAEDEMLETKKKHAVEPTEPHVDKSELDILSRRVSTLEKENLELEERLQEAQDEILEAKKTSKKETQQSEDWGWGEEHQEQNHDDEDIERLKNIEKLLNNRILALEDQHLELEERLQEAQDEILEAKREATTTSETLVKSTEHRDEIEQLNERISTLEEQNLELQDEILEAKKASKIQQSEDWGWGQEKQENSDDAEIERLKNIEKILNNRILALEDQSLELEERLQEAQDEILEAKKTTKTQNSEDWGWGQEEGSSTMEETKKEVERLTNVEKILNDRILALEERNQELEAKTEQPNEEWGWGEENQQKSENSDGEVERLKDIEKILNNRISSLEDRNLELEEKLQEAQDELLDVKKEQTAQQPKPEEEIERLQLVEASFSEKITAMNGEQNELKGLLKMAEEALLKEQERYDELERNHQSTSGINEQLQQLQSVEISLAGQISRLEGEKRELMGLLKAAEEALVNEQEKYDELEKKHQEAPNQKADEEWGWGEEEKESDEMSILKKELEEQKEKNSKIQNDHEEKVFKLKKLLEEAEESMEEAEQSLEMARKEADGKKQQAEENKKLKEELKSVYETMDELKSALETDQVEMRNMKQKVEELEKNSMQNDEWNDDGWGENDQRNNKQVVEELEKRDEVIARLGEELSEVQDELLKMNQKSSDEDNKTQEFEKLQKNMERVLEQNELLKDSEGRLIDQADDFATKMEEYKEKCEKLTKVVDELEQKLGAGTEESAKTNNEMFALRSQLQIIENEVRKQSATISARDGKILEFEKQLSVQSQIIAEMEDKLKNSEKHRKALTVELQRRRTGTSSSTIAASRPSSRLSTSSRASAVSHSILGAEIPEPVETPVPIQSVGSAFDVVSPQGSLEPLRRRNK